MITEVKNPHHVTSNLWFHNNGMAPLSLFVYLYGTNMLEFRTHPPKRLCFHWNKIKLNCFALVYQSFVQFLCPPPSFMNMFTYNNHTTYICNMLGFLRWKQNVVCHDSSKEETIPTKVFHEVYWNQLGIHLSKTVILGSQCLFKMLFPQKGRDIVVVFIQKHIFMYKTRLLF